MARLLDLTGNTYGRIRVLSRGPNKEYANGRCKVFWNCLCDCGTLKLVAGDNLKKGDTTSCGCYNKEVLRSSKCLLKEEYPLEYNSWRGMLHRVRTLPRYEEVGMCPSWKQFRTFIEDMGPKPEESYSIDRRDTSMGYSPDNCRWASKATQAFNGLTPSNNTTGVVGVTPLRGKYQANIGVAGKVLYLGIFDTLREATIARKAAELTYYGYHP